ncbi:MAG: OB-fold nucleic acid binding domain-containing protein, partial [Syntrophobacteraceae bacterium]|nr:OB-fold nucleic acid binding domain-containing protein [Syntrophobacteraceae bacterium]
MALALRETVLKRPHLAAAFRLPSINEKRREAIFPGAMLVTDLIFFRAEPDFVEKQLPVGEIRYVSGRAERYGET